MELRPHPVPPSSSLKWFTQGLRLSTRHPFLFVVTVAVALPGTLIFGGLPVFLFIPLLLAPGVVLAFASENDTSFWLELRDRSLNAWKNLAISSLLLVPLIFLLASLLLLAAKLEPPAASADTTEAAKLTFEAGAAYLITLSLWFMAIGPIIWFLIPLLILENLPLKNAFFLSLQAFVFNLYVSIITSLLALIFLVGIFWGIAIFPLYAITVCMMYASYRHVFYNSELKEKARAKKKSTLVPQELKA